MVQFQSQLLAGLGLLRQPLLQLLLLLQQLANLLVVAEGFPHQLRLGQPGMFQLSGEEERRRVGTLLSELRRTNIGKESFSTNFTYEDQFTRCKTTAQPVKTAG